MTSKERAKLRAEANGLDPIFQIGKEGVTDAVIAQLDDTFNTRELFKVCYNFLPPNSTILDKNQ